MLMLMLIHPLLSIDNEREKNVDDDNNDEDDDNGNEDAVDDDALDGGLKMFFLCHNVYLKKGDSRRKTTRIHTMQKSSYPNDFSNDWFIASHM